MIDTAPAGTYRAALDALQARGRFGIRLGLGRTRALLRALGDPQLRLRGALIGGTNGKGSVQAIVSAVLREAGYRVGQTPKPHLVSYRERVLVEGSPIPADQFGTLLSEVLDHADRLASRLGPPTEFEVLTAAAFAWFARSGVDLAVVEVGLGGRLDATNAWDGGVAVVTNVQYDHTDRLGDTLTAIGREKAAIIKRGDRGVTGAQGEGLAVIRRRVRRLGVPLVEAAPLAVEHMDRDGLWLRHSRLGVVRLALLGRHQAANTAVALATLEALEEAGFCDLPPDAVRGGLDRVRWPGRLELIEARPSGDGQGRPVEVLLDGAHNVAGAAALIEALGELLPSLSAGRPTLLMATMGDKDVAGMVGCLAASQMLRGAAVVTTRVESLGALSATDLASAWRATSGAPGRTVEAVDEADAALAVALAHAEREGGPLVVAGSLYLVGAVRRRLVREPELEDPEG